jgi:hypothetical protein
MKLRRFTNDGVKAFEKAYRNRCSGKIGDFASLLENDDLTEVVGEGVEIFPRTLIDRLDAARYLDEVFLETGMGIEALGSDVGLWTWLSCAWAEIWFPGNVIFSPTSPGTKPVNILRLRLTLTKGAVHRQYLRGAWRFYKVHESDIEKVRVLFWQPITTPGDIQEQFTATDDLVLSKEVAKVWNLLYWDTEKQEVKNGAASKGPGSARRLTKVLKQYRKTFLLGHLTADEFLETLRSNEEFLRFIETE